MLNIRQKTGPSEEARAVTRAATDADPSRATAKTTRREPTELLAASDRSWSSWSSRYAALHRSAREALTTGRLASPASVRALIFMVREGEWGGSGRNATRGFSGGFADRITGLVTMFALCIATQTAFFVDWPGLEGVFDIGRGGLPVWFNASHLKRNHALVELPVRQGEWKLAALERRLHSNPITVVRNDHGALGKAFEAASASPGKFGTYRRIGIALRDLGLDLESAFPRLFDHLFAPAKGLREAFSTQVQELSDPSVRKILVQIRTGDRALREASYDGTFTSQTLLPAHLRFFECAEEVARLPFRSYSSRAAETIIYLMTDSAHIRAFARSRYAHKRMRLLLPPASSSAVLFHSYTRAGLLSVAGDTWLGTMCDEFVVSLTSGLGFQAAFRSGRAEGRLHVLQNDKDNNNGEEELHLGQNKSCWPTVSLAAAAQIWSNI
jgi:hypothetical protein